MDRRTELQAVEALQHGRLALTAHENEHKTYTTDYEESRQTLRSYERALLRTAASHARAGDASEAIRLLGAASEYVRGTPTQEFRRIATSVVPGSVMSHIAAIAHELAGSPVTVPDAESEPPHVASHHAYAVLDWLIRVVVPAWLDLAAKLDAGSEADAEALRDLRRITSVDSLDPALEVLRTGASYWNVDHSGEALLAQLFPNDSETPRAHARRVAWKESTEQMIYGVVADIGGGVHFNLTGAAGVPREAHAVQRRFASSSSL